MVEITQKLEQLLNEKFEQEDYNHFFVVEIRQLPGDLIQVYIDSDKGLQLEDCVLFSRYLEKQIEEHNWLGEKYTLEVSSPGIGTALKLKRQYYKNIGRTVSVELTDSHKHVKGELTAVFDDHIIVAYTEKVQEEGKKKKKEVVVQRNIPFEQIKKTVVKISF